MQKKLLAIAIAAAVTAPVAARADVTVYGQMHYSYDYVMAAEDEGATGVSRYSRIGFKGAEDLGGGLKGVWQIESQIANNSADGSFTLRNTFVGLAGDWGTVLAGRHDTPYKISTQKLDFFTDRAADYNNLIGAITVPTIRTVTINGVLTEVDVPTGYSSGDERAPQTIAYVTPNWSGFSGALAYISHYFDQSATGSTTACPTLANSGNLCVTSSGDEDDTAFSAMLMYDNAGFFATVAYEWGTGNQLVGVLAPGLVTNLKTSVESLAALEVPPVAGIAASRIAIEDPELSSWKVGLGYTFGGTTIGAIWENIEVKADNATALDATGAVIESVNVDDFDRGAYYLTAQHVFGANVIKGYYGWTDDTGSINDSGADMWAVGYDYNFSKRTTLYALYTQVANDDNAGYTANSAQGVGSAYSNPGDDVDVVSVGVIHKF